MEVCKSSGAVSITAEAAASGRQTDHHERSAGSRDGKGQFEDGGYADQLL